MSQNIRKAKTDSVMTVKSFKVNSSSDAKRSDESVRRSDESVGKSNESVSSSPLSLKSSERSVAVMPENSSHSKEDIAITTPQSGAQTTPIMGRTQPMVQTSPAFRVMQDTPIFGPHPILAHCSHCNCECLTETKYQAGNALCFSVLGLCVVTTFCCCCCLSFIPTLLEECYDVVHTCRNCHSYLGTYQRNCC